jgi:AcrR family transcriptional regulator
MEMRRRLAEVAARLFAEQGYDAVSMADVAKAAEVAEQTVYNYFPTKPDLVLDRADDVLEQSRRTVAERDPALTPAEALSAQIHADIDHFAARDPFFARGEFPAQSVASEALRRYALQFRHRQAEAIAEAISETDPIIPAPVARAHAHALMTVIQTTTDRVGSAFLSGADPATITLGLHADAEITLTDAAENFRATQERAAEAVRGSGRHQTVTGA